MARSAAVDSTTSRNMIDAIGDPYKRLATSIILRAVNDYCAAVRKLKACPNSIGAKRMIRDCEKFFRAGWFTVLTDIDGWEFRNRLLANMDRPKERRRYRRKKAQQVKD